MKRAFTFILVVCTLLLLAACGNNQPDSVCQHTFDQWVVEKQATCKEEGLLTRSCTKCDYMEATKIEKTNDHTEVIDPEVPATCEKTGLSEGKHCAVCEKVFVAQQETPIVAHTYSDKCDESCNVCGHIRDVECAHKETEVIAGKAATCTEIGLTDGSKCKKCGEILVAQTTIPVIDHTESDWIVDTEATKTEDGKKHTECTVCGVRIAEDSIPATGSIGLKYWLNEDNASYAVIDIGTCTDTDIVIPDTYNGLPVTIVGNDHGSHWQDPNIRSIIIPNGVTTITRGSFGGCTSLQSITIPDSVTFIHNEAFYGCTSLTGIWVSENNPVYSSDNMGFLFNKDKTCLIRALVGLKGAYTIGDSVTTIGEYAFSYCDSLTSVTIGDSVTTIGEYAFSYCDSLTSVTIPDSVTSIGDDAFYHCTSLQSITIPDSVTRIGTRAFSGCESLQSITIPDSVTSIGGDAFDNCDSLTGIWVSENNPAYSSDKMGVLFNKEQTELIRAPGGLKGAYTIPDSVTSIGSDAFYYCTSLQSITIPDSVTGIGTGAFQDCTSLQSITIPDSVTSIGEYAFSYCESLQSITIPDSVTSIDRCAFYDCTRLQRITYGGTITQWKNIEFGDYWNQNVPATEVICSNGSVSLN